MAPASGGHGGVAGSIFGYIWQYLQTHPVGRAFAAETGFIIARNPDTVRAPDVAVLRTARLAMVPKRGFVPGPPDLAVEVISPDDSWSEVIAKAEQWLAAGAVSVWVANPETTTIHVYRAGAQVLVYQINDTLTNEPVLPGFELKLADVFDF